MSVSTKEKVDYGIDNPIIVRNLSFLGVLLFALSITSFWSFQKGWYWGRLLGIIFGFIFVIGLFQALYMYWGQRVGKLRERERLLDLVELQGDEMVLDIGCGRGLLLNAVAQRLTTGKATGIDLWNPKDQSGNNPNVTWENARLEGVADKIDIVTGDARDMPFADNSFDVVVSSLVFHNINNQEERRQALSEVLRVLKPGGKFAILDFQNVREYMQVFMEFQSTDVQLFGPSYNIFPPVHIVTGQKS